MAAFTWCGVGGCVAVLVLPLIVVLVLYSCEYNRCTQFTATGDPLFDRYAKALIKEHAWRFYLTKEGVPYPTKLPYETLASWEPEFGDDPRYWELVWRCTQELDSHFADIAPGTEVSSRIELAEYLVAHNKATPELAFELWIAGRREWSDELQTELEATEKIEPKSARALAQERVLTSVHRDDMLALLDAVIAADPARSYGYYRRAMVHYAAGDNVSALADLQAGNKAPVNSWRAPYPDSAVISSYAKGEVAGNAAISGLLTTGLMAVELDNFLLIKDITRELCERTGLTGDRALLEQWFQFLCRYGAMDNTDWLLPMVAANCIVLLCETYLIDHGNVLEPEQRKDLIKLLRTALKAPNSVSIAVAEREAIESSVPNAGFTVAQLFPWDASADFRELSDYFSFEYKAGFQSIFERCARFSFETLRFPPEPATD